MKKLLSLFVLLASAASAQADFVVDGFTYHQLGENTVALSEAPEDALGDVFIPATVEYDGVTYTITRIYNTVFRERYDLTSVTFADDSAVEIIDEYAFHNCSALRYISLPNSLKSIEPYTFEFAGNDVEDFYVSLGNGVTSIGERAFNDCDKIRNITIPASVTFIEADAFWNMDADIYVTIEDSETPLTLNCSNYYYPIFEYNNSVTAYVGRNIERTGYYEDRPTFNDKLFSLTFGPNVTAIGDGEYYNCTNLAGAVTGLTNVVSIGKSAFRECKNITSVELGNVVSIGEHAFSYCENMLSIELGDKLETLGGSVFDNCGLTSISLPGTLKVIPGIYDDWGMFERCYNLGTIILGEGIEEIGSSAFYNVLALEEITIPSSVKKIGRAPFFCNRGDGSSLKRLILADSDTPLEFANGTSEHGYAYGHLTPNSMIDYFYLGRDVVREITDDPLAYGCHDIEIGPKVTDLATLFDRTNDVNNVKVHHVTPIAITDNAFHSDTYTNATLWVPGGTVEDYRATEGWNQFANMQTWSYMVTFESKGHGSIAIDDKVANSLESKITRIPNGDVLSNSRFTVTLTPDKGYELSSLTVQDLTEGTAEEEIFVGNTDFTNPFTVETAINHDLAYVATFTPTTYRIFCDLSGGILPEGSSTVTTYDIETPSFTLVNPTRTGYTFNGWTGTDLEQLAMTVTIAQGSIGNRSYTATWRANSYKVHFDANEGTGEMADQTFTYDEPSPQQLTANTFTRKGYDFIGWNTKADGSGTPYTDKQEVKNLTAIDNEVITIYAQWQIITYAVAVSPSENGTVEASTLQPKYGDNVVLTITPATGYRLIQLTVNGTDVTKEVTDGTYTIDNVEDNIKVEAVFAKTGDVNLDGNVDVADIASIIDVMAGSTSGISEEAADVNSDGNVDVADIASVIDIMAALARQQKEIEEHQ